MGVGNEFFKDFHFFSDFLEPTLPLIAEWSADKTTDGQVD